MTDETTVSAAPQDLMPEAEAVQGEQSLKHEPPKRKKTWGENVFNWMTYGGFALIGNELTSLFITREVPKNKLTKDLYADGLKAAEELGKKHPGLPKYFTQGHLQGVLVAVVGGMFMVPFVKAMEDHKGSIVRKFDRKHYGNLADTDPKLIEAHKEMDDAPKQTWGSLWKGRVLTVAAAIGVDSLVGWQDAPSTKLFKNSPNWQRFSSMQRIANETAEASVKGIDTLRGWFSKPALETKTANLTRDVVKQGSWLLVLSTTLTVLFYASSKLFAKKRDEKIERKLHQHVPGTSQRDEGDEMAATPETAQFEKTAETPTPQVKSITRENTIAPTPELSQAV